MQLTPEQAARLAAAPVGRLATAGRNAAPYVIPVCFACDNRADGCRVYSALDAKPKRAALTKLRRVRNIRENPQAALVVDHYSADWSELWYLLLTGRAELLDGRDDPERAAAINLLREKYPQYREMAIEGNPVIKLTVARAVGWAGTG